MIPTLQQGQFGRSNVNRVIRDPNFANVSLLLPLHDANGTTVATDYSPRVKTLTRTGTGGISNALPKFGNNSWAHSNVGDYLSAPTHTDFDPGTGQFMLEFYVYTTGVGVSQTFIMKAVGTGLYPYQVSLNAAGRILFQAFNSASSLIISITGTTALVNSTLYFIQCGRAASFGSANTFGIAVNGSTEASNNPGAQTLFQNTGKFIIGGDDGAGSFPLKGGMNNIRMSLCDRPIAVPTAQWPEA